MFCSLIVKKPQLIPPDVWTAIRFDTESTDLFTMHADDDLSSPDSALILPGITAVGWLSAMVQWAHSDATQLLHRFTRNPYDPALIDSTCTNDRVPTSGQDFHTFSWPITVRAGQPLALMVCHNASGSAMVNLAEFKVWVP
jgi:hypothetical protein